MPYVQAEGARLYYETAGTGTPIVFVHEFAGDLRSWEPQLRHFSRRYQCVAFNARGYPPSDVPEDVSRYSQKIAVDDILAVMNHLSLGKAHVVGLSMGGFATLHLGIAHPARATALVVAAAGYGAPKADRTSFQAEVEALASRFERDGAEAVGMAYATGPYRVQFENKDPRGFEEFRRQLCEHPAKGSAMTMRGVQKTRPSLFDLEEQLRGVEVPTLIVTGDEDEPCLEADLFLKRTMPWSGLLVVPRTGHTVNLEEPEMFNRVLDDFFHAVELGRWGRRDPRSLTGSILLGSERK